MVVLDEAHNLANINDWIKSRKPTIKFPKTVNTLHLCLCFLLLTATPIINDITDLFVIVFCCIPKYATRAMAFASFFRLKSYKFA